MEEWKPVPIPKYKTAYQVSNHGRVRRVVPGKGTKVGNICVGCFDRKGYKLVKLSINAEQVTARIHRLVLLAFVGKPPEGKPHCNHRNGIKDDNRLENLEWVSPQENTYHSITVLGNDVRGSNVNTAKLTEEDVVTIRELYVTGDITQEELAQRYEVNFSTIGNICTGVTWAHIGGPLTMGKAGSRNGRAKLTEDQIPAIRALGQAGLLKKDIAERYGVTPTTISDILLGKKWTHVP